MKRFWIVPCLTSAWLAVAAPALAVSSAELYRSEGYVYGRFEAQIRFAAGDGVVSSFFLWKSGSEVAGTFWNELDFEKVGADCHVTTNALYGKPVGDHSMNVPVVGDACGEYHIYGFEWTPTYIAWQIDGTEVRRETGEAATAFAENATIGMQMRFNVWPGDASFGGNFDPAILPVEEHVAWVKYSSYADGVFTEQWREEFDGAKVPSGWATGSWDSPKGKSTHTSSNVTFADGNAVLSLTDDGSAGNGTTGGASGLGGAGVVAAGGQGVVAGAPSQATSDGSSDDGGGCRLAPGSRSAPWAYLTLLGLAGLLARVRRRAA